MNIMNIIISAMLIIVGIIHLLPMSGVLSHAKLTQLYGLDFSEPNLEILMRHRSVLFGLLGGFLIWAAFHAELYLLGLISGLMSVLSFMILAKMVGNYNAQIKRVFIADIVALICLIMGFICYFLLIFLEI